MNTEGKGLISRVSAFIAHPFTTPMDFFDVILLTMLVTTVAIVWAGVMGHIQPPKG